MAATDAQRAAVAGRKCIVCGADRRVDPAHLIPESLGGCGDALCVTALVARATEPTIAANSTCCPTSSRRTGHRSRTPSGTWG